SAWERESFVTPLIEPPRGPLAQLLDRADEQEWLVRPRLAPDNPRLLSPGILWNVQRGSFAQRTEFFGPIVSVLGARDLDDGLSILNDTDYGLTAGFVGLSEGEQRRFLAGMKAGNLYVNRPITGAVVGRQPFGGRKQSQFGPGAKAGGPDYVLGFCHVRSKGRSVAVARDVLGTSARGEVNFLRYQPRRVVVLVCLDAGAEEVELCLRAARRMRAPVELTRVDDATSWARLEGREALRVRLVGTPSAEVLERAGALGWTLLSEPVTSDAALEDRLYLDEQSISIAYHRHGNTRLRPALRPAP
ncbi:MAG TPA: aldehyde dehydrogenase family protein, partial [Polyangiaceae bacterium]|nr:aldehyde dehydrogenase family protein [Polyangiaceae bacterium]